MSPDFLSKDSNIRDITEDVIAQPRTGQFLPTARAQGLTSVN
jgi:hypothetical protein